MVKNCLLTSNQYGRRQLCMEKDWAWWSEEAQECCIKSYFATDKPKSNFPISDQTEFPKDRFLYGHLTNNNYSFENCICRCIYEQVA